jgi:cobalt-zinc-cadmium efflux system membrane fusion protein
MRTRHGLASTRFVQIAIVLAGFGIALAAFFLSPVLMKREKSAAAQASPHPIASGYFVVAEDQWQSLTIEPVKWMVFDDVSPTAGTIAAADDTTTQVFSPFTGRVTDVFVTVGDTVHQGTPLFSGEGNEYPQAVNDLGSAEESLRAAQVQLHITEANRRRLLKLLRVDAAARKDVEQSKADLAAAVATVKNDEIAVSLVRSKLRVLAMNAPAGSLKGTPSTAPLPTVTIVRSPIDGVVTLRGVGAGMYVESAANGGSNPLFTISGLQRVFFVANATETEIGRVQPGDPVSVTMLAFPGRVFHARVRYIAPSVDPNTHRIAVRAEVDNPDGALRPGMFGDVRITTGPPSTRIGVPESAVIFEADTARVWLAGPNHTLALRYLRFGKTVDGMVEVLDGLHSGDRVVTSGSVFIDRALHGDE